MKDGFAAHAPQWAYLALATLGWRPDDFWNATPAELRMGLCAPDSAAQAQALQRHELAHLLAQEQNQKDT